MGDTTETPAGDAAYALEIGRRVRAAREAAGLTQAAVGERSGVAVPHLSRLEAGPHLPSLKTLLRVAAALGVSVADLLPGAARDSQRPRRGRKPG